jgi:hypothetical protein
MDKDWDVITSGAWDAGDKATHQHVTSALCIAFITLRSLPEIQAGEPLGPHVSIASLWLMQYVTGFGHPDCLTCHERFENARPLGYHEAQNTLERAKTLDLHRE